MNNTPFVTIGIPVYNCQEHIALAIRSVLNQTYTNFELIITDDGSTDGTLDILKQFEDPRISLVADGKNCGISYRLNQQIDMAKGKYFVRMDGDDIMFPYRIEKQISYLEKHTEIDVVGSSAVIIGNNNEILGIRKGTNDFISSKDYLFKARFIHPTVAGKVSWFKKYYYKEIYNGCEDCNLWIRSFKESKFYTLEEPLFFYREPLDFKLKTYLFRKAQGRRMRFEERKFIGNNMLVYNFIWKSFLVSFFVYILHLVHLDSLFIGRRNLVIKEDVGDYDKYLNI